MISCVIGLAALLLAALMPGDGVRAQAASVLAEYIGDVAPGDLAPGADAFGSIRDDMPVAPLLQGGERIGWAFIASDYVGTTGYSGKPIHTMVAVDDDAIVLGVKLVKHSEPIVLIGIPDSKIQALAADYAGLDLVKEAQSGGTAHELDIIAGATVTIMVIDDSIVRAGLKVARDLGLGGLTAPNAPTGPKFEINPEATAPQDWETLAGDGTLRRLSLDVGEVNAAFEAMDDPRAAKRALKDPPETNFIDMYMGLVSVPAVGEALLGSAENANLQDWLEEDEHAIMVAGDGLYSFKGSGYVRGGIFDRIVLIQGDTSVRFRDKMHRRLGAVAAEGAPNFSETDLFKIPADAGFDPTEPFRLQLLVQRDVAAIERVFTTFEMSYDLPAQYMQEVPGSAPVPAASNDAQLMADQDELAAQSALWKRLWLDKTQEIIVLATMLTILTGAFFFQGFLTRSERVTYWFRMTFLTVTLVYLGWYANAQLSVVNLMALFGALTSDFSWQAFLLDPLTFILWFAVAAALIFWGRGAYCGWLCPFGALQELLNQIGRKLGIPQWTLPWGLHERLWPIKYMIFLGLFGVSLASLEQAEIYAEVEPFKTAIILNFMRAWPFVAYVVALLVAGLFVERFFCRYLCPLGAGLAIPARLRMFDWLKRYKECGNPCQTCAHECFVQAIHPTGEINPNECLNCMHCQVLYQSKEKCPVVIRKLKRRETASRGSAELDRAIKNHPNLKETSNV
ncbi:NosR/NirI family transcriptional regulator, nitrous oxide reductase regulator [Roseovarius nanhaiticus]|uniref:NosR/NirI family transcriptional regulator, nitrous oxide reductase regulator n=1 Tax=Roseovarius nanhaiticus TaxID=573024 RepID=A0A1N7HBP8_9RHOB|nr:NosR/NirI family protein [Roseovarius nanhaiticus]SEL04786.1 NosR/NirI family transcriptional regulator, nitrous oxide reductase regulator [Roseovarius nanhaiticus]SIS22171.1 NosR/NirI family transcriptional regulator, nitrous oxide reductase regulator [Roseovarius nanhaiticus]